MKPLAEIAQEALESGEWWLDQDAVNVAASIRAWLELKDKFPDFEEPLLLAYEDYIRTVAYPNDPKRAEAIIAASDSERVEEFNRLVDRCKREIESGEFVAEDILIITNKIVSLIRDEYAEAS